MANHGTKFTSVNLNKTYGQKQHPSPHNPYQPFNGGGGGSYGQAAGRGRGGSAVSGGMMVLSRNRGVAPKIVPKLSIPPPLNLPSLRKEHEKFDILGPGGVSGGGGTGSGSRPSSSGVGWTKPVATQPTLPEKNESAAEIGGMDGADVARGVRSYMPPSARSNGTGLVGTGSTSSRDFTLPAEKLTVLRGEDFPSLQVARPTSSGASQKQRDGLSQKQKQVAGGELNQEKREYRHLGPMIDVHAHHPTNGGEGHGMGRGRTADPLRKEGGYFPDPLPLVRLNPRSDWADDERDTGHGFVEQGRDIKYSKTENYWDRDFDLPRQNVLPKKPAQYHYDRHNQRDNETVNNYSSEVHKLDPYPNDLRVPSREGTEADKWRASPFSKDGFSKQEAGGRVVGQNNFVKENKYVPPHYGDIGRDGIESPTLYQDSTMGKKDSNFVGRQHHQWTNSIQSYNNHNSWDRQVTEQPNRYRGENVQHKTSKSSFASSTKESPVVDPILNMGKRSSKGISEDHLGFDETDIFSGGLVGVIKRKKGAARSTDFHDPARESFEAELERVQKMQELERLRVVEEQERVLEKARREEEERQRKIKEEEERQRRLEEEAREAAWRAEQEHLDAIRKAEELRISREEERKCMQLEEERRLQAAKQKLLELEAKMAQRQVESSVKGDTSLNTVMDEKLDLKEKEITSALDLETWEDSERMVEKITTSASFDSQSYGKSNQMNMRPPYPPNERDNPWRRDVFDNGAGFPSPISDQSVGHYSSRGDAFVGGRAVPRKDFHREPGYMSSRPFIKEGIQAPPYSDEYGYQKEHRWNISGDSDSYGYGDDGWGQVPSHVNSRSSYPERLYPNPEASDLYSYGRSRYSMRHPRVLPPPVLGPSQRNNFTGAPERSGSSAFIDNEAHFRNAQRSESTAYAGYFGDNDDQERLEPSDIVGMQHGNTSVESHELNNTTRCDSQSSLSVSSPPGSPPHLSHDEFDESGDSPLTTVAIEGAKSLLLNSNLGKDAMMISADSVSAVEDEEWTVDNDELLQQQEEYDEDEDEDGFREEDEVREVHDENLQLNRKFEDLELEECESSHILDNVVLGFDEGVEVMLPRDDFEKNLGTNERDPVDAVPSNDSGELSADGSDSSGSSGLSSHHNVSSSAGLTAVVDVTSFPSICSTSDTPVQLQFGLFSGPSLIPSLQIGSIQMPLHIHPPIGTHMHPSRPPVFQFGQRHYTSPISQGILPMPPQSMSLVQPNKQGSSNLNQSVAGSVRRESVTSSQNVKDMFVTLKQADQSLSNDNQQFKESRSETPLHHAQRKVQPFSGDRNFNRQRGPGPFSGGRGRRFTYAVRNTNMRLSYEARDTQEHSSGFQRRPQPAVQRTEFRVRDNSDRRQADNTSNSTGRTMGIFTRSGSKRGNFPNRPVKHRIEFQPSASRNVIYQERNSGYRAKKDPSDSIVKSGNSSSNSIEANLRDNVPDNVDLPLQSGVVRVFEQPGIEAASDGDDFIEVRSKRQMLNDRREKREREIKEKSRNIKPPRKPHTARQNAITSRSHYKHSAPLISQESSNALLEFTSSGSPSLVDNEILTAVTAAVPLAPIGTPTVNLDTQAIKPQRIVAAPNNGTSYATDLVSQSKKKVMNDVQAPSTAWNSVDSQQVMSLTQTQLDDAMKPAQYSHISVGDNDPILPTPSLSTKDKTFTSGASPMNSLLSVEKIQFGAVTSSTILPPNIRVVAHAIGAPGSNRSDKQISRNTAESNGDSSLFFEKEKYPSISCVPIRDSEAETEAAASAIAVTVVSMDDITGHSSAPVNVQDSKSFSAADVASIATGVVGDQQLSSQSRGEESLSVSLPADLSVETTPISLWPQLPSPQSSSNPMLSHFPRGPPSHFPFYDMNPVLGGPIFAVNPHEESSGSQSQPQITPSTSGPQGNWQHGSESFYGPPTGYPGPFIPPPGVQGPTHMVVYNHFAPVGQYGQVGLSYMGTTYVPTGKQADWKHHTMSTSAMHIGEAEMNNNKSMNMSGVQRSAPNMQHLAPGSPLLPMNSPFPMFDLPTFQGGPDLSQARWGHIPAPPLHMMRPLQPHGESASMPSQTNQSHPIDQSLNADKFTESRIPTSSSDDNSSNFPITQDTNIPQFPSELGSIGSSRSTTTSVATQSETGPLENKVENNGKQQHQPMRPHFPQRNTSARQNSGYNYQRGGMGNNHRNNNNVGNEWSNRRMGFHGRNQSTGNGMDRGFPGSKVRQVYVAKTTTSTNLTN